MKINTTQLVAIAAALLAAAQEVANSHVLPDATVVKILIFTNVLSAFMKPLLSSMQQHEGVDLTPGVLPPVPPLTTPPSVLGTLVRGVGKEKE